MSSAVVSTSAASGRPFLFDNESEPEVSPFSGAKKPAGTQDPQESPIARVFQSTIKNQQSTIPLALPASRLAIRPAPEMASSGIPALDALTGGLPRGCLTELCGPASSGRTTVLLAALAAATRRGEFCALIDASDALDPHSAAAAGIDLDHLLWVRCDGNSPQRHRDTEKKENQKNKDFTSIESSAQKTRSRETCTASQSAFDFDRAPSRQSEHRLEQVLRATDLLLESGGFGLIVLDLADVPPQSARRIPLTTWFRFRRAVEHKPTILLAIEQYPIAGSCSSLQLQLKAAERRKNAAHGPSASLRVNSSCGFDAEGDQAPKERKKTYDVSESPTHANLLTGLNINAELTRSRLERRPARSIAFETKTAWAG